MIAENDTNTLDARFNTRHKAYVSRIVEDGIEGDDRVTCADCTDPNNFARLIRGSDVIEHAQPGQDLYCVYCVCGAFSIRFSTEGLTVEEVSGADRTACPDWCSKHVGDFHRSRTFDVWEVENVEVSAGTLEVYVNAFADGDVVYPPTVVVDGTMSGCVPLLELSTGDSLRLARALVTAVETIQS